MPLAQVKVALLGNQDRPAIIGVPQDITEMELLNLVGNVLAIGDQLRAQRPKHRLEVARSFPKT